MQVTSYINKKLFILGLIALNNPAYLNAKFIGCGSLPNEQRSMTAYMVMGSDFNKKEESVQIKICSNADCELVAIVNKPVDSVSLLYWVGEKLFIYTKYKKDIVLNNNRLYKSVTTIATNNRSIISQNTLVFQRKKCVAKPSAA